MALYRHSIWAKWANRRALTNVSSATEPNRGQPVNQSEPLAMLHRTRPLLCHRLRFRSKTEASVSCWKNQLMTSQVTPISRNAVPLTTSTWQMSLFTVQGQVLPDKSSTHFIAMRWRCFLTVVVWLGPMSGGVCALVNTNALVAIWENVDRTSATILHGLQWISIDDEQEFKMFPTYFKLCSIHCVALCAFGVCYLKI